MKFEAKHQGKWVAAKNDKIIADDLSLSKLVQKIKETEDPRTIKYSLVPRGFVVG